MESVKPNRKKYRFTNKKHSFKAMLSLLLGIISLTAGAVMVYLTYLNHGQAELRYGSVLFVCLIISLIGFILAALSVREPDRWYFLSYFSMFLNSLMLILCGVIVYLGVL